MEKKQQDKRKNKAIGIKDRLFVFFTRSYKLQPCYKGGFHPQLEAEKSSGSSALLLRFRLSVRVGLLVGKLKDGFPVLAKGFHGPLQHARRQYVRLMRLICSLDRSPVHPQDWSL